MHFIIGLFSQKKSFFWPIFFTNLLVCSCEKGKISDQASNLTEQWDQKNNPQHININYLTRIDNLPLSGQTKSDPWSDSYWPNNFGGISQRWNGFSGDHFKYDLLQKSRVSEMTLREKAELSPAEKYDIFMGRYDYPLVQHERQRTGPQDQAWEGLCHGWAPAAINYQEPKPIVIRGAGGIEVPFGSSDLKALLTFVQAFDEQPRVRFLGARCNEDLKVSPGSSILSECRDVNAGAFHLVLANELGINQRPFIIDATRDREVWNQPVFRYRSTMEGEQEPSRGAARGTVKEVFVKTEISYSLESVTLWTPVVGTEYNNYNTVTYRYRLELDMSNNIIGGEWLDDKRPDFLWTKERSSFLGYFTSLESIYEASLTSKEVGNPMD